MSLIAKVTSSGPQKPLGDVLRVPLGIDVWEVKPDHLILRGTEAQLDRLSRMGYLVEQLEDVARHLSTFAATEAAEQYHSAASLEEELRQLAEAKPDITQLIEMGRSIEGRPIFALRIGDRRGGVPKILFMGCHHAREWIAVEVPFLLAKELVERADEAPIAGWLTSGEVWVAPMVNPDGHEYSRAQERLWRKNRRRNDDGSFGVDPNRNYGYMWGILDVPTSSQVPSDETYVGPRAFSEPETQAVRDLVGCERFAGVITYHSYSQLILYPWGYTDKPIPDVQHREQMAGMAQEMQTLIQACMERSMSRSSLRRSTQPRATQRIGPTAPTAFRPSRSNLGRAPSRKAVSSCRRTISCRPGKRTVRLHSGLSNSCWRYPWHRERRAEDDRSINLRYRLTSSVRSYCGAGQSASTKQLRLRTDALHSTWRRPEFQLCLDRNARHP